MARARARVDEPWMWEEGEKSFECGVHPATSAKGEEVLFPVRGGLGAERHVAWTSEQRVLYECELHVASRRPGWVRGS